jgi:hypothetical protein
MVGFILQQPPSYKDPSAPKRWVAQPVVGETTLWNIQYYLNISVNLRKYRKSPESQKICVFLAVYSPLYCSPSNQTVLWLHTGIQMDHQVLQPDISNPDVLQVSAELHLPHWHCISPGIKHIIFTDKISIFEA